MNDEYIRQPDKVKKMKLIDEYKEYNNGDDYYKLKSHYDDDDEMEKSIVKSLEEFTKKIQEEDELEKAISVSIKEIEEKSKAEKEKRETEMLELKIRAEKCAKILPDPIWLKILDIIQEYILENNTKYLVSKEEYNNIIKCLDELYTIPKAKNKKTAISKEIYTKIISIITLDLHTMFLTSLYTETNDDEDCNYLGV
jgi:hypothetical protein